MQEIVNLEKTETLKPATIYEVAKLADVSRMTVTRTFAGKGSVAEATKKRVLESAQRLNYTPNLLARGLAGGATNSIGVLWSFTGNPMAPEMTRKISMRFQEKGFLTNISSLASSIDLDKRLLAEHAQRNIDGVVLQANGDHVCEENYQQLLHRFRAVVVVTDKLLPIKFDQVVQDRLNCYRAVAEHFVKTGRKRPGIIIPVGGGKKKVATFVNFLRDSGLDMSYEPVVDVVRNNMSNADAVRRTLEEKFQGKAFPYDSVMCSTDEAAIITISWLNRAGLRVPQDVAVVGFNNVELGKHLNPPLATSERFSEKAAAAIEKLLLNRLKNPDLDVQHEEIAMEFLWRESAGK
ncbi:MAG: LacI family DNA-binding transcriptional regulator [Planctomycetota bacterium]